MNNILHLMPLVVGAIVRPGGRIPRLAPSSSAPFSLSLRLLISPHSPASQGPGSRLCPPLRSDLARFPGETTQPIIMPGNVHENDWVNIKLLYICNLQCHYLTTSVFFLSSQRFTNCTTLIKSILASDQTLDRDKGQHLATWNLTLQTDFQQEETLLAHTRKTLLKFTETKQIRAKCVRSCELSNLLTTKCLGRQEVSDSV